MHAPGSEINPAYYPPRARWWRPAFYWVAALRRSRFIRSVTLPSGLDLLTTIAVFLIPGAGFRVCYPCRIGWAALVAAAVFILVALSEVGRLPGFLAFTSLLSLHISGFVEYCRPVLGKSLRWSVGLPILTLITLLGIIYLPLRAGLEQWVMTPVNSNGRVLVCHPVSSLSALQPGELTTFRTGDGDYQENGVQNFRQTSIGYHSGIGQGPVIALPGQTVEFSKGTYTVDGISHPSLAYMPAVGTTVLREGQWMIWPTMKVRAGYQNSRELPETYLRLSLIAADQIVGQPYRWWFWHHQLP